MSIVVVAANQEVSEVFMIITLLLPGQFGHIKDQSHCLIDAIKKIEVSRFHLPIYTFGRSKYNYQKLFVLSTVQIVQRIHVKISESDISAMQYPFETFKHLMS